jgi:hypothetical protein
MIRSDAATEYRGEFALSWDDQSASPGEATVVFMTCSWF